MKKVILILVMSLSTFTTLAQIGTGSTIEEKVLVGRNNKGKMNPFYVTLERSEIDIKNTDFYVLSYRNKEHTSFVDSKYITFTATPEELEYFYNFLKEGMSLKKGTKRNIEICGNTLIVTSKKGWIYVWISHEQQIGELDGIIDLTKKQLERLFGKI